MSVREPPPPPLADNALQHATQPLDKALGSTVGGSARVDRLSHRIRNQRCASLERAAAHGIVALTAQSAAPAAPAALALLDSTSGAVLTRQHLAAGAGAGAGARVSRSGRGLLLLPVVVVVAVVDELGGAKECADGRGLLRHEVWLRHRSTALAAKHGHHRPDRVGRLGAAETPRHHPVTVQPAAAATAASLDHR